MSISAVQEQGPLIFWLTSTWTQEPSLELDLIRNAFGRHRSSVHAAVHAARLAFRADIKNFLLRLRYNQMDVMSSKKLLSVLVAQMSCHKQNCQMCFHI